MGQVTNAGYLALVKGNIFITPFNGQQIYLFSIDQASQNPKTQSISSNDGSIKFLAKSTDNALIYTNNQKILQLDNNLSPTSLAPTSGQWAEGNQINDYLGNIYILNSSQGQIYKYTKTAAGYGNAASYIDPSAVDIKDAVSFTIDGSIYVLAKNGQAIKLSKGQPQSFNLSDIPTPPKQCPTNTNF
ncbi:MAG: hypothetical protein M1338_03810 [Patescibacteria group bacterium]|nr:hypothetical protein [Patescibacteria group bacterium]